MQVPPMPTRHGGVTVGVWVAVPVCVLVRVGVMVLVAVMVNVGVIVRVEVNDLVAVGVAENHTPVGVGVLV